MKILIRVLAVVAILIALYLVGFAVVNKYEDTKVEQRLADQRQQAEANAKAEAAQLQVTKQAEDRYNELVIECQKGRAAYDNLPTAIKSRVEVPTCPAIQ